MKKYRYIDIVFIIAAGVFLCFFVSLRVVVKEILVDRMGVQLPWFNYVLYDLNTTIEMPEEETSFEGDIEGYVKKYKYKLNAYTTSAMAYNQNINEIVIRIKNRLVDIPVTYSSMRYAAAPSENVIAFSAYLEEKGIPFLYIVTPTIESVMCRAGEMRLEDDYIGERHWFLLQNLNEAEITTVDLAQELAEADLRSYDESAHWFPGSALYSVEIISEYLNRYGFEFDSSLYYKENTWDYFQDKEEWTKIIYDKCGYQYSLPIPNGAKGMNFRLEYEDVENGWTVREGNFEDVFLQQPDEFSTREYHGFSVLSNYRLHRLYNENAGHNAEKRILIIGDSFNYFIADYLAVDVGSIDVIHNATYVPSIREHIEGTNPDIVLIVYHTGEMYESVTEEAYKLD